MYMLESRNKCKYGASVWMQTGEVGGVRPFFGATVPGKGRRSVDDLVLGLGLGKGTK